MLLRACLRLYRVEGLPHHCDISNTMLPLTMLICLSARMTSSLRFVQKQQLQHTACIDSRGISQELFYGIKVKQKNGVRKDKMVEPCAALDAAFARDKKTAALGTGLGERSAVRCMLLVANELAERCALAPGCFEVCDHRSRDSRQSTNSHC